MGSPHQLGTLPDARLRYLIVPEAHVRIFDVGLQHEMYDVFHLHWGSRLGHMLGTLAILSGIAGLLYLGGIALAGPGTGLAAASLVPLSQLLYAWFLDRGVWLAVLVPLAGIAAVAWALADTGAAAPCLYVVAGGVVVQTGSHVFEPVPPPWSGTVGWRGLREVVRTAGPSQLAGLVVLTMVAHVLELWAAFRILSYQVLFVLTRFGYRPSLRQRTEERRAEILADYRRGWGPAAAGVDRVVV